MGKQGDLWDDSALINAFDDAIAKYKTMHKKGGHEGSAEGGEGTSNTLENSSALFSESNESKRQMTENSDSSVPTNTVDEIEKSGDLLPIKENQRMASSAYEPPLGSSDTQHIQGNSFSNVEGSENCKQLVDKYYELEEQRQKVLQQLQHIGYWNYQASGFGVQWYGPSTSPENQPSDAQASYPDLVCNCCPYVCQCSLVPCTSLTGCSSGGTCVDKTREATKGSGRNEKLFSVEDGDIVKTALGAAESALSSLKINASDSACTASYQAQEREVVNGDQTKNATSETDLAVVLNAWYSAGFHTAKYLTEKSLAKKRHG